MPSSGVSIPGWLARILAPIVWFVAIPLVHGVVPWGISLLTPHYGWTEGQPGAWNLLGFIPLALGAVLLIWVFVVGMAQTPERVRLGLIPSVLMSAGPYRFTRNPMYVAEAALWLGWAIYFGSIGVLAGAAVLCMVVNFVAVPREERTLETAFGQNYVDFKNRVPRWFGASRR